MAERYSQHAFKPPPGATELIIVRHGASAEVVPGQPFPLVDGHGDPPLSPAGEEPARAVAHPRAQEPR